MVGGTCALWALLFLQKAREAVPRNFVALRLFLRRNTGMATGRATTPASTRPAGGMRDITSLYLFTNVPQARLIPRRRYPLASSFSLDSPLHLPRSRDSTHVARACGTRPENRAMEAIICANDSRWNLAEIAINAAALQMFRMRSRTTRHHYQIAISRQRPIIMVTWCTSRIKIVDSQVKIDTRGQRSCEAEILICDRYRFQLLDAT